MLDPRLRHVVAVARSGSFTSAAQSVGVTQSAVTKSIADLEQRIGFAIFYRTSRGTILTEKGRDFVERAEQLLDDARRLYNVSDIPVDIFSGVLRIGVCPGSLEWALIKPLGKLLAQHKSVRLDVISSSFESMIQRVRNGGVDVAVGYDAAFSEWGDLKREPLGELETPLFVRKGHPLLELDTITTADLAAYDFVNSSESRPYAEIVRNIYENQGVDWRKRLHLIDYFPTVRYIVATTDAIGFVSRGYAKSSRFRAQFTILEEPEPFPPLPLCAAVRARWEPKPAARAFIALLRENLAQTL
jgi:DNA-binding transcriptional LysR family regulator